jgi:hypothetical protein
LLATYKFILEGDAEGKGYSRVCEDPCASLRSTRFMMYWQQRMGPDWRPDRGITNQDAALNRTGDYFKHLYLLTSSGRIVNESDSACNATGVGRLFMGGGAGRER